MNKPGPKPCRRARFYVKNSMVDFEEDDTHEFKGHRNLSIEELPSRCYFPGTERRSRKSVSRYGKIKPTAFAVTFGNGSWQLPLVCFFFLVSV